MTTVETIMGDFIKPRYDQLMADYQAAVAAGVDIFRFEGNDMATSFAKYLIEYLDPYFKDMN